MYKENYDYPPEEEVIGKKASGNYQQIVENPQPFGIVNNINYDINCKLSQPFIPSQNLQQKIYFPQYQGLQKCKYCGKQIIPQLVNSSSCVTHLAAGFVCLLTSICCLCACITPLVYTNHCFETSDVKCPVCRKCLN